MKKSVIISCTLLVTSLFGNAQYNSCAGKSEIIESRTVEVRNEKTGKIEKKVIQEKVKNTDNYGNASGSQYDLAVDGAFKGQTIVVLHFCARGMFDFEAPKAALAEKGFSIYRFKNEAPSPEILAEALSKACQLWVISDNTQKLNDEHAEVIKYFFDSGRGVYLWGDDDPYNADVNFLARKLVGIEMSGNYRGDKTVTFMSDTTKGGMQANHLITTGLEFIYEGITISHLNDSNQVMTPLIYSSDDNIVTAFYDEQGQRLIIDGGFTRLYKNWDSAGTGR
ncbi:MAG: hypothetical protein ACSHXL_02730, partial [Bacteroidota bacterium]